MDGKWGSADGGDDVDTNRKRVEGKALTCVRQGGGVKGMRLTNGTYGFTIHESNREDRVDGMN